MAYVASLDGIHRVEAISCRSRSWHKTGETRKDNIPVLKKGLWWMILCASLGLPWPVGSHAQASPPPGPPPPPPSNGEPYKIDGKWINSAPTYPKAELAAGVGGKVVLLVTVNKAGIPTAVHVESTSGNRFLDQAAIDAAKGWHFPHMNDAKAGAVIRVPIAFEPGPPAKAP